MGRLEKLDLTKHIDSKSEYKDKLKKLQLEMLHMQPLLTNAKRNLIIVFEGPDAAGKGGVIKRFVEVLDPRLIRVYSVVKPTPEEYAHHYMWRFWQKVPKQGEVAVFDRSWYGRVLVERVEGFATKAEWNRAYTEINQFEQTLVDGGAIIIKFYLHITKDEQLRRFEKRAADPYKHWKITDEDWRNRDKWDLHNKAAEEMFEKTDKPHAPWILIEGNYKLFARIKVMKHIVKCCRRELNYEGR
ncbi:MAG: UDP-galactose-lipid carrier transferase [Verrucomicrobiota bacterium]